MAHEWRNTHWNNKLTNKEGIEYGRVGDRSGYESRLTCVEIDVRSVSVDKWVNLAMGGVSLEIQFASGLDESEMTFGKSGQWFMGKS